MTDVRHRGERSEPTQPHRGERSEPTQPHRGERSEPTQPHRGERSEPTRQLLNPEGLIPPHGHTHVVAVSGGTTLYLAGQSAYGADSQLVGVGDHYAQTEKAFQNVLTALAAAGATWRDVVKATYYMVDTRPETLDAFVRAMNHVLGADADPPPAATFVGVASLAYPDMLVEIDVIAVI